MLMGLNKMPKTNDLKVGPLINKICSNNRLQIQNSVKLENLMVELLIHQMMNLLKARLQKFPKILKAPRKTSLEQELSKSILDSKP